ncbi:ABC transporter substrate-binding protein [Paenibacillus motobuensis]|uniref:ABC transporter substrate-binding protein n=1 Tax=Paenibacillus motobuensis TaxID=295324 RepID=A0ABN0YPC3_9BACL
MKKTWVKGLLACSLAAIVLAGCGSNSGDGNGASGNTAGGKPQKLVISTWGFAEDFYNKEVYEPFEKAHNVKIVLETGNNADRLSKIMQGSSDVDVIYLSDYYAQQGIEAGVFEKIDRSHFKNLDHIYDIAQAPNGEDYGPAYTIGQLGIAYDPQAAGTTIESWSDLWNPELKGKLTMPSITSTSGPMMVDAASIITGSTEFNEDKAFEQLAALNPSVVKYYSKTSEFVNMFTQGEAAAGPIMQMYLNDLQKAVPGIEFVTPKEGAYAIINTLNVVKGSKNKELAEQFIDWQLSQEVQEKAAKAKVDSPANKDVKLTDEEAAGVTYGADVVENLQILDMAYVNSHLKAWTDRFNREVTR